MRRNIFVDLDGVLADFDKKILEIFGEYPEQFKKNEWKRIANYPNFYGSLDLMPNALEFWNNIVDIAKSHHCGLYILTGLPMGGWADPQKREWCKKHLNYDYDLVITCFSKDKHNYCSTKFDILIDDRLNNCQDWIQAGGMAYNYESKLWKPIIENIKLELETNRHSIYFVD